MVTPKGSMWTEGETLQVSVLPYRCSICPPLVTRQMSILYSSSCHTRAIRRGRCQSCNQVSVTHVCGRNLIIGLTSVESPRVDISSTCKVGHKLGVPLPLLICSPSAWLSRLLYRRGRKSRRDLWITLYYPWNTIRNTTHRTYICSLWLIYYITH